MKSISKCLNLNIVFNKSWNVHLLQMPWLAITENTVFFLMVPTYYFHTLREININYKFTVKPSSMKNASNNRCTSTQHKYHQLLLYMYVHRGNLSLFCTRNIAIGVLLLNVYYQHIIWVCAIMYTWIITRLLSKKMGFLFLFFKHKYLFSYNVVHVWFAPLQFWICT